MDLRLASAIPLALATLVVGACTGILGLDDLHYTPPGDGGPDSVQPDAADDGADDAADDVQGEAGEAGVEGPTTVAQGLPATLGALAADAAHFYVVGARGTSDGSIQSVPKGGGAVQTIATAQTLPLDIAVDGQNVYWSVSEAVPGNDFVCNAMYAPKNAGGATPTCVTQSQYATVRMVTNDTQVVLLAQGTNDAYIGYASKATALSPFANATTQGPGVALATSDSNAYVSDGTHIDAFSLGAAVQVGASPCDNNCGDTDAVDMVLDVNGANVLWATSGGDVFMAPTAVTTRNGVRVGSTGATPLRIARDATYVYLTASNGSIYAMRIATKDAGASPITLATNEPGPFGIVVDAKNVYWTTSDGRIRSIAAPAP